MNCTTCLKINSLPDCLGPYASMTLLGLSFPSYTGEDIVMKVTNTATRQVWYVPFVESESIDLDTVYPLMQHYYKLEFFVSGVQIPFVMTNPDDTEVDGCCIEFIPLEAYEQTGSEWPLSTTNCVV